MKHTRRNAVLKRMCLAAGLALFALVGASAGADEPEAGNNPCIDRGVTICQPGSLSMYDLKFTPANSCSNACTIICLGDTIANVCVTVDASDGHYYQDSTCPQPHIVADYPCPVEYSVSWKIEGPPYAASGSGDCTGSFAPTASGHGKVTFTAVWSSPCGSCGTAGTNTLSCDYLVVNPAYLRAEGCGTTVEGVPVGESITAASTLYVTVSTTDVVRISAESTPPVSCECLNAICWNLTGNSEMYVPSPTCPKKEGYVRRDTPGCVEVTVDCCEHHGLHLRVVVLEVDLDIDSDHTSDFGGPQRDDTEESIEEQSPGPPPHEAHKYVVVDDYYEADTNGIPGYADGFNLDEVADNADDVMNQPYGPTNRVVFVPIMLAISNACDSLSTNVTVKFTYSESPPADTIITTEEGQLIYRPAPGNLRIWTKDQPVRRTNTSVVVGGDFVPSGVDIPLATLGLPGEATLYLEGITNGLPEVGKEMITVAVNGIPGLPSGGCALADVIHCTVIRVDVDVDTDNDNGFAAPERNLAEDHYEDITNCPSRPGKILVVNDDDNDGDGIPDFADGYNRHADLPADAINTNEHFARIVFELPLPIVVSNALVRLEYDASEPLGVWTNAQGICFPAPGSLRIWTNRAEVARNGTNILAGGDYVPAGTCFTAEQFGFRADRRVLTNYVEAVSNSVVAADKRVLFLVDPDGTKRTPPNFIAADAVRLTAWSFELREVALDQDGYPLAEGGMPVLGDIIPWTDLLSTYVPYDGGGAPDLDSTSSRWVTFSAVTNAVTNSATLTMTQADVDWFKSWEMDFECVTTNGACAWLWQGTSNAFLRAEIPTNASGATMPLTITYLDVEFSGQTNAVQEYYILFRHEQTNGFWGSTYAITDPREDIGMPAFSPHNAFVVRVPPEASALLQDNPFCEMSAGKEEPVTVPLVQDEDGAYVSCLVVPVSLLDGEADLGLEVSVNAIKLKFDGKTRWQQITIDIGSSIPGKMKQIAKKEIQVQEAALFSALVTDEENGTARANQAVTQAGETAIRRLGFGVTPLFTPTKEQINDMLERHSVWVHSGHGEHTRGIDICRQIGRDYRVANFKASDISASDLNYDLVFMNTCESTDRIYFAIAELPQGYSHWNGPYSFTNGTAVLDIARKLNAKNYVGWDCRAVRQLSVAIPTMLMDELDSKGSRPEDKRTVAAAVGAIWERLQNDYPRRDYWYYGIRLRLVDRADSVILDLNRKPL